MLARWPDLHRRLSGRHQRESGARRIELRGRDLSAGELRSLFEACARAPQESSHQQDSGARRRRDAAFLAIAYGSGVRRAEAIALDLADLDFTAGQLRVRQGKGKKPRQPPLAPSAQPALEDRLQVRGRDPGPSSAPCQRPAVWTVRAPEAGAG